MRTKNVALLLSENSGKFVSFCFGIVAKVRFDNRNSSKFPVNKNVLGNHFVITQKQNIGIKE